MSTTMLGTSESTEPRPRRKTNEPSKPDKHKHEVRRYLEDVKDAREKIMAKKSKVIKYLKYSEELGRLN